MQKLTEKTTSVKAKLDKNKGQRNEYLQEKVTTHLILNII